MITELEKISSSLIISNPWWDYRKDIYKMPAGIEGEYHYVDSKGSTMVIPVFDDGTISMIRQFRYLNGKVSIEFPGGGQKHHLSFEQNALEELREEAGLIPQSIKLIAEFNPFNGVTNELCRVFLAEGLVECESKPEPSEEFEIIRLNKLEILRLIQKGEIWDGMTLASWALYQLSEQQYF